MDKCVLNDLIKQGYSTYKISKKLNICQSTVRYWLRKYKLKTFAKSYKCKFCGELDVNKFYGHRKSMCNKCFNNKSVSKARINRQKILDHFGNKCSHCGYEKYLCSLQVHHLDRKGKDPSYRSVRSWSWNRIKNEIKKCVMLCANCHIALHNGLIFL